MGYMSWQPRMTCAPFVMATTNVLYDNHEWRVTCHDNHECSLWQPRMMGYMAWQPRMTCAPYVMATTNDVFSMTTTNDVCSMTTTNDVFSMTTTNDVCSMTTMNVGLYVMTTTNDVFSMTTTNDGFMAATNDVFSFLKFSCVWMVPWKVYHVPLMGISHQVVLSSKL